MSNISDLFIEYTDQIANDKYHADYIDLPNDIKHKVDEEAMQIVENETARQMAILFPHFKDDLFDYYKVRQEEIEVLSENETAS